MHVVNKKIPENESFFRGFKGVLPFSKKAPLCCFPLLIQTLALQRVQERTGGKNAVRADPIAVVQ